MSPLDDAYAPSHAQLYPRLPSLVDVDLTKCNGPPFNQFCSTTLGRPHCGCFMMDSHDIILGASFEMWCILKCGGNIVAG